MSWPTYPAYTDVGISWLDNYPAAWTSKPLKFLATMQNGASITAEGIQDSGEYPVYGGNGLRGYTSAYTHQGDRVLIGRQGALCGNIHLVSGKYWASEHAIVTTPERAVSPRWLAYVLGVMNLGQYSQAAAQPGIAADVIGKLRIPTPSQEEQECIADVLDSETAKIDALIVKHEHLIATLREDRSATITHAVTKGLDDAAEMKESGVGWLGQIPKRWEVIQSRRVFTQRKVKALAGDEQLTASQKYGVIPQKEFMEREDAQVTQVLLNPDILKHVECGDFVISMRSFQGGIEYSAHTGAVSSAYVPLIPGPRVHAAFFRYALKSSTYIQALQSTSNLVRDGQALRFENFSLVPLALLPMIEQKQIAEFLDDRCAEIDVLAARATQMVATLREYRSALITDAVTGKINLRGSA